MNLCMPGTLSHLTDVLFVTVFFKFTTAVVTGLDDQARYFKSSQKMVVMC